MGLEAGCDGIVAGDTSDFRRVRGVRFPVPRRSVVTLVKLFDLRRSSYA